MHDKYRYGILLLVLAALSIYFYHESITLLPSHIHSWTQSDRYAIALSYLHSGFQLFVPRTYNLSTVDGITGVDLPIHEYVVACLMKVFGNESPIIFRSYVIGYSMLGYLFLCKLVHELTGSFTKGVITIVFVFTCPIIAYYQSGFIPSATSFSSALIAYYFYFKHKQSNRIIHFNLALLMMTLAVLSRMPFHIFLFAMLFHELWVAVVLKKVNHKKVVSFCIAYGVVLIYGWYKSHLNETYGSQFLTQLMPADNFENFSSIIYEVWDNWAFQFLTLGHYVFLLLLLIATLYNLKINRKGSVSRSILKHGLLVSGGSIVYFIIMAKQFVAHEYYFIDSFYLGVILILVALFDAFPKVKKQYQIVIGLVSLALIIAFIASSKSILKEKYAYNSGDRGEITRLNFMDSDVYLNSIGVPADAKILVLDAYSSNMPLILMKRRGYTVINTIADEIETYLEYDFDYVVMQDVFMVSDVLNVYPEMIPNLSRVGGNSNISVFEYNKHSSISELSDLISMPENYHSFGYGCDMSNDTIGEWFNSISEIIDGDSLDCYYNMFEHTDDQNKPIIYGPTLIIKKGNINRMLVQMKINSLVPIDKLKLALIIENEDQPYHWDYPIKIERSNLWQSYSCLFVLPDDYPHTSLVKCFLWNEGNEQFSFKDMEVKAWSN